jgi:hypothetical protein
MPGQLAEANQNVNAGLAGMIQQGKMFGTQGFGNMSQRDLELMTQVALANQGNQQANEGRNLNTAGLNLSGQGQYNSDVINANNANLNRVNSMQNLYSATPGLANQFANQFQNNVSNWLNAQGQLNQINQNAVGNQFNTSQMPSDFQIAAGRVGTGAKIAGRVAAGVATGGASEGILAATGNSGFGINNRQQPVSTKMPINDVYNAIPPNIQNQNISQPPLFFNQPMLPTNAIPSNVWKKYLASGVR